MIKAIRIKLRSIKHLMNDTEVVIKPQIKRKWLFGIRMMILLKQINNSQIVMYKRKSTKISLTRR